MPMRLRQARVQFQHAPEQFLRFYPVVVPVRIQLVLGQGLMSFRQVGIEFQGLHRRRFGLGKGIGRGGGGMSDYAICKRQAAVGQGIPRVFFDCESTSISL